MAKSPDLCWHYFFPAFRLSIDPVSGGLVRHHFGANNLNKLVMKASRDAGIRKMLSWDCGQDCGQVFDLWY